MSSLKHNWLCLSGSDSQSNVDDFKVDKTNPKMANALRAKKRRKKPQTMLIKKRNDKKQSHDLFEQ